MSAESPPFKVIKSTRSVTVKGNLGSILGQFCLEYI